ncbi:enamine deaminase RidA [Mesorhizobium huakuii]|nr:enamine deaminase RidA [Mesorhizobium huakuii]
MKKQVIEVPVMSDKVRSLGLPCSTAVKANGFVFISATPPVDMVTGEMVRGDIEVQTEASLKALKHCLEAAGTSLDNVVMVRIYAVNSGFYNAINRVYARYFSVNPPAREFRAGGVVADGVRYRDRVCRGGVSFLREPASMLIVS